jgi:beta-N-acetylhexosaminidase
MKSKIALRLWNTLVAALFLVSWLAASLQPVQATVLFTPEEQAASLLERLTPEERAGQLFLITFPGNQVDTETNIYDLIANHHVGGVVLLAENDNIQGQTPPEVLSQFADLSRQIQQNEWFASTIERTNSQTGEAELPAYIPLFVGLAQEGDGFPYDQIMQGVTPLPNEMALGATWMPELSEQTGSVLGDELTRLGVNLLLGPSLDVLEAPNLGSANNLGTRTFGGDPYWVSEMGRAFIRGVHQGSQGHLAVVAKHFPGHGSSDRVPEEEVATVRKSLDELTSFDLTPFFAVTGNAQSPGEVTDALLVSHIRYQGLQGNIRSTTRPVSLDPQAFSLLMGLAPLNAWRSNGGVMISDDLGSMAMRRFYDLSSQAYDARRVALNAFLAGNDLLYIGDFSSADEPDAYQAAVRTIDFFAQKYREDAAFAQRVDESVLRILTLKFRLYTNFVIGDVLSPVGGLNEIGESSQHTFEVARQAATLISPTLEELDVTVPDPPNQSDRIVFISDTRTAQQCSTCPPLSLLGVNDMQNVVVRLYGPQAGGQIRSSYLTSYTLADLDAMLINRIGYAQFERDLSTANWIVFLMLNAQEDAPSFNTLSRFLAERPDLFLQTRVIVFALCAPYFLDATDISKLTAYYTLYSKTPQFVDTAAYLLFQELRPAGAPPVSVAGISYNLNEALFPDPDVVIPLTFDLPQPEAPAENITPTPQPLPEFHLGDVVPLRAGVILDHNGNPVPDGTPVNFVFVISGEPNPVQQEVTTTDGIARTTFAIAQPGTLEIFAVSENAASEALRLDIPAPGNEVATVTPSPEPSPTPSPTPTQTVVVPVEVPSPAPPPPLPGLADWVMAILIAGVVAWSSYRLAAQVGQVRWGVRAGFLALIFGLLSYSYLVLGMPGSQELLGGSVARAVFVFTLGGSLLGLILALIWRAISRPGGRPAATESS